MCPAAREHRPRDTAWGCHGTLLPILLFLLLAPAAGAAGFPWAEVPEVLLLRNYNTRLVVVSTLVLGMASGVAGSFLLLRKRSLMGDALSHACLPGIGLAFWVMVLLGGSGKWLPGLLLGGTLSGAAGVGVILLIRNTTRIKDDAAMGIVLSVFFGWGVAVLGMVQELPDASAAGLESFITGKTASMVRSDFLLIAGVAIVVLGAALLLRKEFTLLSFDEKFADTLGWPVNRLDLMLLALVTAVTVVGLQAVGLILIIAFLIIPAAAARFWTDDLRTMLWLAGGIGGVSGWLGASLSALLPRLPAGAVIVLVAAAVFLVSLVFGPARGVWVRWRSHRRLQRKVGRQHLLRAMYELIEARSEAAGCGEPRNEPVPFAELLAKRSWTAARLRHLLRQARREDHVDPLGGGAGEVRLSESGFGEAARTTRNHRLWEIYLITHADVAPQHVDRDADMVEHVLGPDLVRQLEHELELRGELSGRPHSPHRIETVEAGA